MRIGMELDLNRIEPHSKINKKCLNIYAHISPRPPPKKKWSDFFSFFSIFVFGFAFFLNQNYFRFLRKFEIRFFFWLAPKKQINVFFLFFLWQKRLPKFTLVRAPKGGIPSNFSLLTCAFPVLILPFGKLALGMHFYG